MSETGILYYLPILDNAMNNSKEKVLAFLDTQILNRKDVALCSVLKKIRTAFANSDYSDFVSFYKDMETKYLTDFVCETYPNFFVTINSKEKKVLPSLFTTAYTIRRQFIFLY